jgi:hypothetical protein
MNLEAHQTACGGVITIPQRVQSHLQAHPDVLAHLPQAICKIQLPSDRKKIEREVQMGCVVGRGGIVKTSAIQIGDRTSFAVRANRKYPSRVAPPGVVGAESTTIVIIAKPTPTKGRYELITAWVGILARKEPWDPTIASQDEFNDCLHFWRTTALVFDPATMSPAAESSWGETLAIAESNWMMIGDDAQTTRRPQLRLVHGGVFGGSLEVEPMWRAAPELQTSKTAQEDRLRHAILRIVVEEFGQTVDEVLREINEKLDSEDFGDYSRAGLLSQNLQRSGLRYMIAPPHLDLESNGYLQLYDAKRLLAHYPDLSTFRPEDHDFLTIGELSPSQRSGAWLTRLAVVPFLARRLTPGQGESKASTPGYFDVPETSPWGHESNRLRRAILSLRLDDVGVSVREGLIELCKLLEPRTNKGRDRVDDLRRNLEAIGLSFKDTMNDVELPVSGYLTLLKPEWLLRRHPELAALHPVGWHFMRIA